MIGTLTSYSWDYDTITITYNIKTLHAMLGNNILWSVASKWLVIVKGEA